MKNTMKIVVAALFVLHATIACDASEIKPKASYIFRPAANDSVPDEGGNKWDGVAHISSNDVWVDTNQGPALQLKNENDKVELPADAFPGVQGSVRVVFRPDGNAEEPRHLFRVYHAKGDGLTLYMRNGALRLSYYNRSLNAYVSAVLPTGIVRPGEWTTATASWDLEGERRIQLQVDARKAGGQMEEGMRAEFHAESKVIVGNEHEGGSLFLGAIHSVQLFDEPLWENDAAASTVQPPAVLPKVARERVLPRTLFFSRTQPKYDLFTNTLLRRWVDRPLFFDRRTGESEKPYSIVTCGSFLKIQESLRAYGLDGFGHLIASRPFQGTSFLEQLDCADAHGENMVPLIMEIGATKTKKEADERKKLFFPLAKRALESPNVLRIGGRILVLSYVLDRYDVNLWTEFRESVRKEFGDKFLFVVDVTSRRPSLLAEFEELGGISEQTVEDFRKRLRTWLDVSDGIMWAAGSHTNHLDGTLHREFYREFLVPIFNGILNEEPYRGKLLGLDAEVGYINMMTSRKVQSEEGTRRLRDNFEIALEANPDFITMPEWDELNENTSIGPTLTNSLSTQRIVRYYTKKFAGEPNTPLPGDNTDIPNLVLSVYPYVKLGDAVNIEVLSIPESGASGEIAVELGLKNARGDVVKTFPKVTLPAAEMADHVFSFPSEALAQETVLRPFLKVTSAGGQVSRWEDGLESIRLLPTWNLNYKATKIPLRDLLQPEKAMFTAKANGDTVEVSGSVACDEKIMSVEVVQDSRELYAVDPMRELTPQGDEALIMLQWQAMRKLKDFAGTIEVHGGTLRKFEDWTRPEYKRESYRLALEDGKPVISFVTDDGVNSTNARGGFFLIGHPEEAVISIRTKLFNTDFAVKDILASGKVARVFPNGLTIEAQKLEMLPQVPYPILENEASFSATVRPWRKDTPLQMRVVTESGKIYRSAPIMPFEHSAEMVSLPVWSESDQEIKEVTVSSSRVPSIGAIMDKAHEAALHTDDISYFQGLIGGLPFDMAAFAHRYLATAYPSTATDTAPKWAVEDGALTLQFDGKGNFLYFPEETLPRGSFALEFEIKPGSDAPQLLCTSRGYRRGALTLTLANGELQGEWLDRSSKLTPFQTGLHLPKNEWSHVKVQYDLDALRFTVNGKSASVPRPDGAEQAIVPFIFGGYGNGQDLRYFAGFLRALRIRHASAPEASQSRIPQGVKIELASF